MKKFIALGLVVLFLAPALFADDAKVMPMKVGRFYLAPNFTFIPGSYDEDGKYHSFDKGSAKLFNLAFALEYGVIDWITAAVQWVPGLTVWSDLEAASGFKDSNANDMGDLFVGAKIQVVEASAPVQNDMFRAAATLGAVIPIPGPDFEAEFKEAGKGNAATLQAMDNHVWGAGARFYLDWNINEYFFLNLYNETILYLSNQDLNKASPTLAGAKALAPQGVYDLVFAALDNAGDPAAAATAAAAQGAATADLANAKGEVDYQYRLTFEIEPVFTYPIADGMSFSAGLPINFRYIPAYGYSVSKVGTSLKTNFGPVNPALDSEKILLDQLEGDAAYALGVNPNVSLFLTKTPLPLEFKYQYSIPVWGQSNTAKHTQQLQIRAYFRIP